MTLTELNPVQPSATVLEVLGQVIDPELGVDVVNLGLVYELHLVGDAVTVVMTLTTPGCPMHGTIEQDVRARLERLPGVTAVDLQLVWDPPWHPRLMTEAAKRQLYWI